MKALTSVGWTAGWAFIVVGFVVLIGGSAAWAADYVKAVNASDAPSWLTLLGGLGLGAACNGLGLASLAASADRRNALRQMESR